MPVLTSAPSPAADRSVKAALADGTAIVVELQVDKPGSEQDARFLKEVGESVSFEVADYDPETGNGKISSSSFGYGGGTIAASASSLRITSTSPMGCSGSFKLDEKGLLRGNLDCRWGNPYPSQYGTIDLGLE